MNTGSPGAAARSQARRPGHGGRGMGEAGSAYVMVLLVLVVLTIMALAIAVLTGTEVQLGANERLATRTFYAAESGIGVAVARVLVSNDYGRRIYSLPDERNGLLTVGSRIEVSPVVQLGVAPCNLCQINQGSEFARINHGLAATASRVAVASADPDADPAAAGGASLAERTVTVMVDVQPREPVVESLIDAEPADTRINF